MVPCRQKANTRAFKRKNCPNQLPTPHQCTQRPPTSKSCTKQIQQGFFPHRATKRIPSLSYLLHFTLGVCGGGVQSQTNREASALPKGGKKKKEENSWYSNFCKAHAEPQRLLSVSGQTRADVWCSERQSLSAKRSKADLFLGHQTWRQERSGYGGARLLNPRAPASQSAALKSWT